MKNDNVKFKLQLTPVMPRGVEAWQVVKSK